MRSTFAFLALGTNLGDRAANLRQAILTFPPKVEVIDVSHIYETQPWGVTNQPLFLNMVIKGKTRLNPEALLANIKQMENRLGRLPSIRYGPRKIDIDILFYDDLVVTSSRLSIPHPGLADRAFVLAPLAELAPELVHPVLKKTIRQMLAALDTSGVQRYG